MIKNKSGIAICWWIFISILMACNSNKQPHVVSKDGFEVVLPGYLEADELAEDAVLEYANRYRNLYLVVLKHPKNKAANAVDSAGVKRIEAQLDSIQKTQTVEPINGYQTIKTYIDGMYPNESKRLYYYHYTLDCPKNVYEMTIWTRGADRNIKYKEDFEAIVGSFKEK